MGLAYMHRAFTWQVRGQPTPAPRLTNARKYDVRLRRQIPSRELAEDLVEDARAATITRGYYAFKEAVRAGLLDAYPGEHLFVSNMLVSGWPFHRDPHAGGPHAILEYSLWMAQTKKGTCRHGDPDNIAKAILDALFPEDRHVLPRCQAMSCGTSEPRVAITVTLLA